MRRSRPRAGRVSCGKPPPWDARSTPRAAGRFRGRDCSWYRPQTAPYSAPGNRRRSDLGFMAPRRCCGSGGGVCAALADRARERAGAPVSELDVAAVALARSTVERAAPEEMVIFPAASDAYLAGGGEGGGTRMLGFGVEAAVTLLTPIAIEVAKDVLGYLKEQVTELASKKGKEGVDAVISRLEGEEI